MFGLSESHYNIVKRVAKQLGEEINDTMKKDKVKYDQIAAAVISKHHEKVATLVSRGQLVWLVGYLHGRFGNTFDRE